MPSGPPLGSRPDVAVARETEVGAVASESCIMRAWRYCYSSSDAAPIGLAPLVQRLESAGKAAANLAKRVPTLRRPSRYMGGAVDRRAPCAIRARYVTGIEHADHFFPRIEAEMRHRSVQTGYHTARECQPLSIPCWIVTEVPPRLFSTREQCASALCRNGNHRELLHGPIILGKRNDPILGTARLVLTTVRSSSG